MELKVNQSGKEQELPTGFLSCFDLYCWGKYKTYDDSMKMTQGEIPFNKSALLFDLSLFVKGAQEDKHFMKNVHCYNNIRRGNTLFTLWEVYKPEIHGTSVDERKLTEIENQKHFMVDIYWGRRGMFKFFDMYVDFLEQEKTVNLDTLGSFNGNFNENYASSEKHKINLRKIIFMQPEATFLEHQQTVICYKLLKANGENAQISFNPKIDSWMCASKNVCLAARNRQDIEMYQGKERFSFARLIAEAWFNFLDSLQPEQVLELQKEMTGYSWIGEYCGDQNHQHLVLYTKITILFYAIVDHNNSEEPCIPPLQAYLTFRKFKCDTVSIQSIGNFKKISEMYSQLKSLFDQVSQGTIRDEEEGSVLYFVKTNPQSQEILEGLEQHITQGKELSYQKEAITQALSNQKTLSLCKLKTLEYRIYRKLREKLKSHTSKKNKGGNSKKKDKKINEFMKESQELTQGYELPKPLEYYFKVAEAAFQYLEQDPKTVNQLHEGYISFIQTIIAQVEGQTQAIPPMLSKQFGEQNQIEEEQKKQKTEVQQIQNLNVSEQNKAQVPSFSCVLLTPPHYLSENTINSIKDIFSIPQQNEVQYNLQTLNNNGNIYDIQVVPKDTKPEVVYIIAGWTENGINLSEKTIIKFKESQQPPSCPQLQVFYQSESFSQLLKQNWNGISNFFQKNKNKLGNFVENYEDLNGQELVEAIKVQSQNCAQLKQKNIALVEEVKQEMIPQQKISEIQENILIVVVPIGIPGMGKTYNLNIMIEILKELNVNIEVVSSDKVRRQCMVEWMKKTRCNDEDQAFNKTNDPAKTQFFNKLQSAVRQAGKQPGRNLLFLDKNHPQNALNGTFTSLRKACSSGQKMKIVALLPYCQKPFQLKNAQFPFGLDLLVTCLIRALTRKNHETLNGTNDKIISIVMMFFNLYRNIDLSDQSLIQQGFSHVIKLPFASEGNNFSPQLIQLLQNVLFNLPNGSFPKAQEIEPLTQYLQRNQINLKPTDSNLIRQMALQGFLECFNITQQQPTANKSKPLPIFLGIEVNKELQPILLKIVTSSLKELSQKFPNEEQLQQDLQEFSQANLENKQSQITAQWSLPKDFHMTTLFVGGNKQCQKEIELFPEGVFVCLQMSAFVYVPGKIMCSMVVQENQKNAQTFMSEDGKTIQVDNRMPHITLLLNKWPAKSSNNVLESLGAQHGPLQSHLQNNFLQDHNYTLVEQYSTIVNKENVKAYVIKLNPPIQLKGLTKLYYQHLNQEY